MHHKSKDTVRKRGRRIAHKGARAKTKRAIEGTPVRSAARGDSWGVTMPQPPIFDAPSTKGAPRRRPTPKKKSFHSPCRGGHEWYEEVVEGRDFIRPCPYEIEQGYRERYPWYVSNGRVMRDCDCVIGGSDHPRVWFRTFKRIKTCIDCWEVRTLDTWDECPLPYDDYWSRRYRRSYLKPRTAYRRPKVEG